MVAQVTRALQGSVAQLNQVQEDLHRVTKLRQRMAELDVVNRYGSLIDRYLPPIDTLIYLMRTSPQLLGRSYVLTRDLSSLGTRALDPLEAVANPQELSQTLQHITQQSLALESELGVVRRAKEAEGALENESTLDTLKVMEQGARTLRHFIAGIRGLIVTAEAASTEGFLSEKFGSIGGKELKQAQQELEIAQGEMAALQSLLGENGATTSFLSLSVLENERDAPTSAVDRLDLLLEQSIDTTRFLWTFLGFEGPRRYLLLGQNQNEIRATGGFIGVAVEVTLDEGILTNLVYHDSTTVDPQPLSLNPPPPDGLYWYLWHDRMLFRDANWNPHFPAAAAKIAEIYRLGQGVQVDGVITGTKALTLDIVDVIGDMRVPGAADVLSRERAEAYAEGFLPYPCQPHHSSDRGKRCFDEDLFFQLNDRLTAGNPAKLRQELVKLFQTHLDRRNIFVHVFDPLEGNFLWEREWNGAITPVDHDFLMVIDSSLPGHAVIQIRRSWEYRVSLDLVQPMKAQLRLRYHHATEPRQDVCLQSEAAGLENCYWNFFRVYIPQMAQDIQMPEVPLPTGSEKLIWGYTDADSASVTHNADIGPAALAELSGYIVVEPGSMTTIPIQYQLPPQLLRSIGAGIYEYRLLVQKQPGIDQDKVQVALELPPNTQLLRTSLPLLSKQERWLLFDFFLESDTLVTVSFRTGKPT